MTTVLDRDAYESLAAVDADRIRTAIASIEGAPSGLESFLVRAQALVRSPDGANVLGAMSVAAHAPAGVVPAHDVRAHARTERIINDWMVVSGAASIFLGKEHAVSVLISGARDRYLELFPVTEHRA